MDSFDPLKYLVYLCFWKLQKLIVDRFENKISKLKFSQKKLDDLPNAICEFKLKELDSENLNLQFIHSVLDNVGKRLEDFLKNGKKKANFILFPGEKLLVL